MLSSRTRKILIVVFCVFILLQVVWWSGIAHNFTIKQLDHDGESKVVNSECHDDGKSLSMQKVLEILTRKTVNTRPLRHGAPYIVTAASSAYFDRFENFVGSIHRIYESKDKLFNIQTEMSSKDPTIQKVSDDYSTSYWWNWNSYLTAEVRPIVVYNLGLTSEQVQRAKTFKNVEVVDIDFKLLPSHFNNLKSFAWKPLVMYLALQRYPAIFFLDSGVEIWNRLDKYESILMDKGYFHVVQEGLTTGWKCCGTVGELTHISTFNYLGFSPQEYGPKVMCSGGIQGYIKDSPSYRNVLLPTLECAWNSECIAPKGSSLANHRQDQSVFSLFIHKAGLVCETDPRLWGNPGNRAGIPDSEFVIYLRKGDRNKPYLNSIEYEKQFAIVIPVMGNETLTVLKNLDSWNSNRYSPCWNYPMNMKTDLVMYMVAQKRDESFEADVKKKSQAYSNCFNKISFKYVDLQDATSSIVLNKVIHDESIFNTYEYFFFMGPNTIPIRSNWINEMDGVIAKNRQSNPGFWMIGSSTNRVGKSDEPSNLGISINSIFSTHISLRSFIKAASSLSNATPLNVNIYNLLHNTENTELYKQIKSRIVYHDIIQNMDKPTWSEENIRTMYPNTYILNGGIRKILG